MSRQSRTLIALVLVPLTLALPQPTRADDRPALELSLQDAVKRTLENNVDIAVDRYNPELSEEGVRLSRGVYDPVLTSTLNQNSRTSPATNAFAGADKPKTDTFTYNIGATQYLVTGGSFNLSFNNSRQDSNSLFTTINPQFNSFLTATLSQPLLRNFRIDSPRQTLRVAKKNKEISDVQFRQTVVNTVAGVKQQYYDLIAAIDNLGAARKSLTLARKLLDENQIKVRVGTMAPLDVVSAESEVASRDQGVIVAEAAVSDAEDALKRSIFPKNDPASWALRIVPTDRASAEPRPVDVDAAIKTALEKRTDVVAARKAVERAGISVDLARNQTLPQVDLVASYGTAGVGGTQLVRDPAFGGPVVKETPGGYGDAVGDVFGRDFPTWSIGVNVTYSVRNRQAGAAAAQARISRDQAEASYRRLELQVVQEVRSAGRAVESGYKSVEATRAARVLSERRLDAEEKRFAAGMSTNFFVTQAQRDLAVAEFNEIQAIGNYEKSLVNFERVQEAGLSGAGASALVTTTAASASAARTAAASAASAAQAQTQP